MWDTSPKLVYYTPHQINCRENHEKSALIIFGCFTLITFVPSRHYVRASSDPRDSDTHRWVSPPKLVYYTPHQINCRENQEKSALIRFGCFTLITFVPSRHYVRISSDPRDSDTHKWVSPPKLVYYTPRQIKYTGNSK